MLHYITFILFFCAITPSVTLSLYINFLHSSTFLSNKSTPTFLSLSLSLSLSSFFIFACSNNKIIIELTFVTMAAAAAAGALTLFVVTVAVILNTAAADPEMLQDVCVADLTSPIKVNGFPCKANFSEMDFFSDKLAKPAATNNTFGSTVTAANVQTIPGLNTLGVSLARIDYAPGGINPPHTHPRATEIVFVLEGQLDVGFFTTANVLVSKSIKKGENFVFPRGLVHFQKNNGNVPASVIAGFNSQLQGTQNIALTLFASTPPVADNVLTKTFQVGTKQIEKIKSRLAPKK